MLYAVPTGKGGYFFVDSATAQTVTTGNTSLPAGWFAASSAADRQQFGVLPVTIVGVPADANYFDSVLGAPIVQDGVATQTWQATPRRLTENYDALIKRRAAGLTRAGKAIEAFVLLRTIGA